MKHKRRLISEELDAIELVFAMRDAIRDSRKSLEALERWASMMANRFSQESPVDSKPKIYRDWLSRQLYGEIPEG